MNECNLCRYMQNKDNLSLQSCSKWVTANDFEIPCTLGGNPGDSPPENQMNECTKIECPAHCQYPYTNAVYTDDSIPDNYYDNNEIYPAYRFLNNNSEDLNNYVTSAISRDNIKTDLLSYDSANVPENLDLKCGALLTPEEGDTYDFPELPSEDELRQTFTFNIELLNRGILWGAVKRTDKLNSEYGTNINDADGTVTINDFTVPISDKGIELEWWDSDQLTEEQLKAPLPTNIREYQTLENIHQITGAVLSNVFPDHTIDNMVIEEVYDWLMKNNIERIQEAEDSENQGESKFTMAGFFGITTDQVTNRDFEICFNQIMMTEHDDDEHLRRINSLNNLSDLGDPNNRQDMLYVEAKILKFLILEPSKVGDCFDIVYLTDEVCQKGLTSDATQMMGNLLKMNTDNVDDENYDDNMRVLTKRLLKYVPDILKKLIDIAEYYEKQKCDREVHKNTKLLKEIYNNLFKKNNMKIELPSIGFTNFFEDFEQNIFTKMLLLIFIAYIVTQFIKLFTVNVNLGN